MRPSKAAARITSLAPAETVAYIRMSTHEQSASPEEQLAAILAYIERLPGLPPFHGRVYTDLATSAAAVHLGHRVAGRQMLDALKPGDVIVVTRLDRVVRSIIDAGKLLEVLNDRQVSLHLCQMGGGLDTSNIFGKSVLMNLAVFAELEGSLIRERTKAAIQRLRQGGKPYNQVPQVYHRRIFHPDGSYEHVLDPAQQQIGRAIFTAFDEWKLSVAGIAKLLSSFEGAPLPESKLNGTPVRWTYPTVRRVLRHEYEQRGSSYEEAVANYDRYHRNYLTAETRKKLRERFRKLAFLPRKAT